jgi:hypothetical protein
MTLFNIHAISYGGAGHESVYFHGGVGGNLDSDDSLTTLSTFYAHHLHFDNLFLEVLNRNQHIFMEV